MSAAAVIILRIKRAFAFLRERRAVSPESAIPESEVPHSDRWYYRRVVAHGAINEDRRPMLSRRDSRTGVPPGAPKTGSLIRGDSGCGILRVLAGVGVDMTLGMNERWSTSEKQVARRAFDAARGREYKQLLSQTRQMADAMQEPSDLWRLHDFLTETRREIDEKYDYRYSVLIVVFARLIHEGWLSLEELEGLSEEKLAEVEQILELARQ